MSSPTPAPTPDPRYNQTPTQPQPTAGSGDQLAIWLQQQIATVQANQRGSTVGKLNDRSQIYLGQKTQQQLAYERQMKMIDPSGRGASVNPDQTTNMQSYAQAKLAPLDWNDDQLSKFVNQGVMNKIKGFDVNMGMPEILSAWDDLIQASYGMNLKDPNNPKWTPEDVMNTYANPKGKFGTVTKGNWEYDIATGEKIRYVGPLSKTTTSTQINELTREDALALAKNSMASMLGRAPSNSEVGQYLNILNGYEREHPQTTTTTTDIDPNTGEAANSSAVTTGGTTAAGRQALLEEQMKQSPEYGAFQAATTGMSWLAQAISKGVY